MDPIQGPVLDPILRTAKVRIEGVAELAADVVLQCSGTSQGAVTGDLQVSLNTGESRPLSGARNR